MTVHMGRRRGVLRWFIAVETEQAGPAILPLAMNASELMSQENATRTSRDPVFAEKRADVSRGLLEWFRREGRDLPWKHRPNPYRVWVSEISRHRAVTSATPAGAGRRHRPVCMRGLRDAFHAEERRGSSCAISLAASVRMACHRSQSS